MKTGSGCSVQILCKAPVQGYCKTRLAGVLSVEGLLALQRFLILRAVRTAVAADIGPVTVWCAPHTRFTLFDELVALYPVSLKTQASGDLGQRMHAAACYGLSKTEWTVLIGTDCPVMTAEYLRLAADRVRGCDTVLGPAEDGGYVLLGLARSPAGLFRGIAWGTSEVLEQTLVHCRELALSSQMLPKLWDIDRPEDLQRWMDVQARAVRTAAKI